MEKFHHKLRNFKAGKHIKMKSKLMSIIIIVIFTLVMVALANEEVRIYKDRYLVNKIVMDVRQYLYNACYRRLVVKSFFVLKTM